MFSLEYKNIVTKEDAGKKRSTMELIFDILFDLIVEGSIGAVWKTIKRHRRM